MKKYVFFLAVAVFFLGCDDNQEPNVPMGMSMEAYANYKKLGFSDEQIAKNYKKGKSLREPIRFDNHR